MISLVLWPLLVLAGDHTDEQSEVSILFLHHLILAMVLYYLRFTVINPSLWNFLSAFWSFFSSPCSYKLRRGDLFSLVAQLCPTFCNPMYCSTPGFPVQHQLPWLAQTHIHWVGDAIQPSHHLLSPSPPAFNLSQHQDLFRWVSSSHQVAKVLEFQLQHQSFQCIFRVDFL